MSSKKFTYKQYQKQKMVYEVELIALVDLYGKDSIINDPKFQKFLKNQTQLIEQRTYEKVVKDDLCNIESHLKKCSYDGRLLFNDLNRQILRRKKITRRVLKKNIVYKNEFLNILAIKIINRNGHFNISARSDISKYDTDNRFITYLDKTQPLKKYFTIKNKEDLIYVKTIIKPYISQYQI